MTRRMGINATSTSTTTTGTTKADSNNDTYVIKAIMVL